jgi:hypothetical protein
MYPAQALLILAVATVAFIACRSARRGLAVKLVHDFAEILDAIDAVESVTVAPEAARARWSATAHLALADAEELRRETLLWPLLLGRRRAAIVGSFLDVAHGLDDFAEDASRVDATGRIKEFATGVKRATMLGDESLLSLRD